MQRKTVMKLGTRPVVIMDSIGRIEPDDAGAIIVASSHGGRSSAEIALGVPLAAVIFNDAGGGKDDAGISGLSLLEDRGIAAATVGHDTACIGDPFDMWESGVITHVNAQAAACGLSNGQPLREAINHFTGLA